ncbi:MAG TPA: hemerythrin domain-containing protein [Mycobacteriales bacterium]|nr:hemerythrin domain-containing protein [Mycobacteriales bacterium]
MSDDRRDVIEVLEHDHREVEELFARFRTVSRQDSEERQKIADQLVIELVRHSVAEDLVPLPREQGRATGR